MKKYIGLGVFALAFSVMVLPAFAEGHRGNRGNDELEVKNYNRAYITNNVDSESNTGYNEANRNAGIGRITTGNAVADSLSNTTANENRTVIECTDCLMGIDKMEVKNSNSIRVKNDVEADADTGNNEANSNKSVTVTYKKKSCRGNYHRPSKVIETEGRGVIQTGNAQSVATAFTTVNSNITRIR